MARPRIEDPKTELVTIRLTKSERERLERDRGSRSITDHIRRKLFAGRRS